jgi:hypothetical protein
MTQTVTATKRPHWGTYRTTLTACASKIAWCVLTDAQCDVLYLNKLADRCTSLHDIAIRYRVAEQTVPSTSSAARSALPTSTAATGSNSRASFVRRPTPGRTHSAAYPA